MIAGFLLPPLFVVVLSMARKTVVDEAVESDPGSLLSTSSRIVLLPPLLPPVFLFPSISQLYPLLLLLPSAVQVLERPSPSKPVVGVELDVFVRPTLEVLLRGEIYVDRGVLLLEERLITFVGAGVVTSASQGLAEAV